MSVDLFGHTDPAPLLVRLDRRCDRERPCCTNVAQIRPGRPPHAAELRCNECNRHRGWLPKAALDFLTATAQRFGAPVEPLVLRDSTIGDHAMAKYDDTNRGALFRDDNKQNETDRDYSGTLNVDGREFWISGWVKTSKKGAKYLSLSVKAKDADTAKSTKPLADDLNDAIGF
jgi:hypothetical protein